MHESGQSAFLAKAGIGVWRVLAVNPDFAGGQLDRARAVGARHQTKGEQPDIQVIILPSCF
jgi:hypothetical protein